MCARVHVKVLTRAVARKPVTVRHARAICELMCNSCMGKCKGTKHNRIYSVGDNYKRYSKKTDHKTIARCNQSSTPTPIHLNDHLPIFEAPQMHVKC